MAASDADELRAQIHEYLSSHHVMTVATAGPPGHAPHAAHVFYVADSKMRLIFLSKGTSLHSQHIGHEAPVAVTVSEEYEDWHLIQGVQLWGKAKVLRGPARVRALAKYSARFPFVRDLLRDSELVPRLRGVAVYRIEPDRAGFTDNTSGLFGRETLTLTRD